MKTKRSLIAYGSRLRGQGLELLFTDDSITLPRGSRFRGNQRLQTDAVTGVIEATP